MKTATDVTIELYAALSTDGLTRKTIEDYLTDFEADIRADERIKATADAYDKVASTMVPREGANS